MKSAFILHTRSLGILHTHPVIGIIIIIMFIMCPNIESIPCPNFEFDHVEFSTFKMAEVGRFDCMKFTIILLYTQHYFAINKQPICH